MLNKLQKLAYDSVLNGPDRITIIIGPGGVGKSFCAAQTAEGYPGSVLVCATTNKAASVLRGSTGMDARTIQSVMGFKMKRVGYSHKLVQEREPEVADLVIVDEISMLPQSVYSALLQSDAKKILFLGDPVQLPAIGAGVDVASIPGRHIELTEQMRQSGLDVQTIQYLKDLRHSIENNITYPKIPKTKDLIVFDDFADFADLYNRETGTKKIISYRNASVDAYNRRLSGGAELFSQGDKVTVNSPIGDARNGDTLSVNMATEYANRYLVELDNGEEVIHWKSKVARDAVLRPLAEAKDWNGYWKIKDTSVDLKHLYACTAHKSQGSTYGTVYLDGTDIVNASIPNPYGHAISEELMMRLSYVALSRMRHKVVIFKGTTRRYSKLKAVK